MIVIKDVLWLRVNVCDACLVLHNKHIQSTTLMEKSSALRCVTDWSDTGSGAIAVRLF